MSASIMSSLSMPVELFIPPIMIPIPIVHETQSHPIPPVITVKKQEQKVYHKNYIQYDFPSPISIYPTCIACNISFEHASTRDNQICTSCEIIRDNHRWYHIPFPTCSICETECYYIHRQCNHAICRYCKYHIDLCPYCNYPV